MTLQRIRNHILEQARSQADEMLTEARLKAAERLKETERDEAERLETDLAALGDDLERVRQQELAKQRTENRAQLLRLKTGIIEEVFVGAAQKLLTADLYRDWLRSKLREVGETKAQIVCRPEDRDTIAQLLGELGLNGLSFGEGHKPPTGGFILHTENYDVDVTLDAELTDLRQELTPELADKLSAGESAREQD